MSLGFGLILAEHWPTVLLAINPAPISAARPHLWVRNFVLPVSSAPLAPAGVFGLIGTLFFYPGQRLPGVPAGQTTTSVRGGFFTDFLPGSSSTCIFWRGGGFVSGGPA